MHTGATPVLVDIDPDTYNLDPRAVAAAVTTNTRAILPVHLFGLPADMGRICALASRRGPAVVEDCAQSLGARIAAVPRAPSVRPRRSASTRPRSWAASATAD